MAIPKSWTAADVALGKFSVMRDGTLLHVESRYQFEDDTGTVLTQIAGGKLVEDVEWSTIPTNIQDALLAIDNWRYNQILAQEGMEDV